MYFQKHLPLWQVKSESKEGSSSLEGSRWHYMISVALDRYSWISSGLHLPMDGNKKLFADTAESEREAKPTWFNLPDRKWDLHICCGTQEHRVLTSSKKRTSAWSDHLLLSSNHRESWIPLDLPGCSGSAFIAELPTLELMPRSILGVSKSI